MATSKIRPIRVEGNVAYVPLTKGYEAVIDVADVKNVAKWNWQANPDRRANGTIRTVYAQRSGPTLNGKQPLVQMHRALLLPPDGSYVDHIDGDGLNNRRSNLRLATKEQNGYNARTPITNTSGLKGVSWDGESGKWRAQIMHNGKKVNLGRFLSREEAYLAYCNASAIMRGEFAMNS